MDIVSFAINDPEVGSHHDSLRGKRRKRHSSSSFSDLFEVGGQNNSTASNTHRLFFAGKFNQPKFLLFQYSSPLKISESFG